MAHTSNWYTKVESYFIGHGLRHTDAQDAAQDVAIAYVRLRGIEPWNDPSPQPILLRSIMRKVLAFYIRQRLRAKNAMKQYADSLPDSNDLSVDQVAYQHLLAEYLISLLPDDARKILEWLAEGFTYAEIARMMNRPIGTVKAQFHRAVTKLRYQIENEGCNQNERTGNTIYRYPSKTVGSKDVASKDACDNSSQPNAGESSRDAGAREPFAGGG